MLPKPRDSNDEERAHNSAIGAVFCIPKTGNVAVDAVAALPGPGAIGLNGFAQLQ